MNNKTYYGEYSLKHWIDLILSKNIELPPYQRIFVWNINQAKKLIDSLEQNLFIPPITLGAYWDENRKLHNLIIDGQQRLTSIFLAYLGIFPDNKKFQAKTSEISLSNDEEIETDDYLNLLQWKFDQLLKIGGTKDEIIRNKQDNYLSFEVVRNDDFFENHTLSFSYIVPQSIPENPSDNEQSKYYSTIFRNINKQGNPLQKEEIRESLYYFNKDIIRILKPEKSLLYRTTSKQPVDFVRYLALAAQYANCQNTSQLTKGYKTKLEDYYTEYIKFISGEPSSIEFNSFVSNPEERIDRMFCFLNENSFDKTFDSKINIDVLFLGIIYYSLFENKQIKDGINSDDLKNEIIEASTQFRKDEKHVRAPNSYKYLKTRFEKSLEIWGKYVR